MGIAKFNREVRDGYHRRADVTGAVNGTANAVRLTVTGHPFVAQNQVLVSGVGGVTGITAGQQYQIVVVDANHIELVGSTFGGSYTSGGVVTV